MPVIFSLDQNQQIQHEIAIDENFILMDDDFITIEIGNGFDWHRHSHSCSDCKEFLSSIGSSSMRWLLQNNDGIFLLDLNEFGNPKEHFMNQFVLQNSEDFYGTKAKFKKVKASINNLERLRRSFETSEEYERCAELRDAKKFIEGQ